MSDESVSYTVAASKWRRSGYVEIASVFDTPIASFPMAFLASCGDNSWDYILKVVVHVIERPETTSNAKIIELKHNTLVDLHETPLEGSYRYLTPGKSVDPIACGRYCVKGSHV